MYEGHMDKAKAGVGLRVEGGNGWGGWGLWGEMETIGLEQQFFLSFGFLFKDLIYLLLDRGEGREKERERNIPVWLPLVCPLLETRPATQACALTGN